MRRARAQAAPPRVLLIGAGRFGQHHLSTWLDLQQAGVATLAGVVVRSAESAARLRRLLVTRAPDLPVHAGFDVAQLAGVDAVDIAVPSSQHAALVAVCLPHADVLCEKPLAADAAAARRLFALAARHGRLLMACHNYLLHPVVVALQQELQAMARPPHTLRLLLSNPAQAPRAGDATGAVLCPFEEWLHAFYLVDAMAPGAPRVVSSWRTACTADVSLAWAGGLQAQLAIGWRGAVRQRRIELGWPDLQLRADLDDGQLLVQRRGQSERRLFGREPVTLAAQLGAFAAQVGRGPAPGEAQRVVAALGLMARARAAALRQPASGSGVARPDRARVLVVGGGVFGATAAIELGRTHDVTLAERHGQLLAEASWLNQWRHHSGFHYPRSLETIEEVRQAKAAFEEMYERAIARDVTAYYAVSALGREITRARYLAVCQANGLNFREVDPPADIVDPAMLQLCLHTDEAVVRMDRLSRLLMQRLRGQRRIALCLGTAVTGGRLLTDGGKQVQLDGPEGRRTERFDFVVNATYAGTNAVARWFGFPLRPMRFDLLEMAVFRIPKAPRFMMTILDAPFTSLTHTGVGDRFLLSHIHQSVLASQVTADGLPPRWGPPRSNRDGLLAHGLRYLPILARAQFVESRIGVRTVEAFSEDFDGRPTVVTAHGFGCWSVLGGKIITAVSNAREIVQAIDRECGGA